MIQHASAVVDTVWVTFAAGDPGIVEHLTAWSTVAVAAFALVALFLPWLDRRRHRKLADARVGTIAHALAVIVGSLCAEMLQSLKGPPVPWLRTFLPQLAECRDRITELALQAREASPGKEAALTRALAGATYASSVLEFALKRASQPDLPEPVDSFLRGNVRVCHHALVDCARHLERAEDPGVVEQLGRVMDQLDRTALDPRADAADSEL